MLTAQEARTLLASIGYGSVVDLRDCALIALMVYSFARVGTALKMRVADVYTQGRRTWVRLHEKGGKRHEMPCHHTLEETMHAYIAGALCQHLYSNRLPYLPGNRLLPNTCAAVANLRSSSRWPTMSRTTPRTIMASAAIRRRLMKSNAFSFDW